MVIFIASSLYRNKSVAWVYKSQCYILTNCIIKTYIYNLICFFLCLKGVTQVPSVPEIKELINKPFNIITTKYF